MVAPLSIQGMASLRVKLAMLVPSEIEAGKFEMKVTLLNVQNGAKQRVRVDRGDLRNRIAHETSNDGLIGRVGTNSDHGPANEFGRRPGKKMPPVAEIRDWAKRHGIKDYKRAAFVIARAIGRRGIPAQPFLFPAVEAERASYLRRLTNRLNEAHEKVASGQTVSATISYDDKPIIDHSTGASSTAGPARDARGRFTRGTR